MTPPPRKRRGAGDGGLYRRTSDGLWIASLDLGWAGGKRRRKVVSSRDYATAARKLRDLRRQVEDHGDIPTKGMTVAAWLEHWLTHIAAPRVRPRTLATYRGYVRTHIVPAVGKRRLDQLAPQHVRAMHKAMTDAGLSTTSALQAHHILARALRDAMREGLAPRNVAEYVDPPRKAASTRGALSLPDALTLLRHVADDPLGSRWAAALLTGARQGELLGLEVSRVTDVLDLSWQLQRLRFRHGCGGSCRTGLRGGACPVRELDVPPGFEHRPLVGGLVLTRPKSRAGTRIVPLVEPLATILRRHIDSTGRNEYGLVWVRPDGQPIDPSGDSAAWHAALAGAGLPRSPLHSARHTTATLLQRAGVPQQVITAILGHSQMVTTQAYQHDDQTLALDAMRRLGRLLDPSGSAAGDGDDD